MSFAPVEASKNISEKYKRYLSTIFTISDESYYHQFKEELIRKDVFSAGPYLDVTDSFVKGSSIEELIAKNELAKGFSRLNIPQTRPLYKHQEIAISRVIKENNIVVSTGTGSGKTESFLIPILNHIIWQHESGKLNPGVRALLIYPMNALANDQIERLRGLLVNYPEITYGSYTGQTKNKYNDAIIEYKSLNNGQVPKENELISREQMKANPPHIFITNYAMLEYLMLRPEDSVFFSSQYSSNWKFIVLDEAHVYNGSTGIEVSMLLRRLKATLRNNSIRYILTSATLGGENDNKEVAEFAHNLCDSEFDEKDVIRAYRITPKPQRDKSRIPMGFYVHIAALIDTSTNELQIIKAINSELNISILNQSLGELLYDVVLHDETYWEIRTLLMNQSKTVETLAKQMSCYPEEIASFVTVASKCEKNGDRLFDARYHMFLRATESVFITLSPSKRLFLTRKDIHYEKDGTGYKVFEIGTCSSCHAIYLVGKEENGYFIQSNSSIETSMRSVYLLADTISDTDEDHTLEDENIAAEEYELCPICGYIMRAGAIGDRGCEHDKNLYSKVIKVKINNDTGKLTKCLSCENINSYGIIRMFFTGQEAVTSVIGTALFGELPSYRVINEVKVEDEDDTGFGDSQVIIPSQKVKEAKQFIAFSDSRQAAAFYASYLDQTHRSILYKRLIVEALNTNKSTSTSKGVGQFVESLIYQFEKYEVANNNSEITQKEAWKAVLTELVDNNGGTSLYSMGLIGIGIDPSNIPPNNKYNLSAQDVTTLCSVFALGMMSDAAIDYSIPLNKADKEFFTHNGIEYSYTLSDSNAKSYKRSFIPTKANMNNKRLDYLTRVIKKKGFEVDKDRATKLLSAIWERILCAQGTEIVKASNGKYRLDINKIVVTGKNQWYICSKCNKVTIHNVNNVCPTYKCDGELAIVDLNALHKNNHYYQLYQTLDIRELRVVEHTAQLDKETAYEYQKKFQRKEIDVLSCSTTFEMGVDVGSLETVFMRNMPPSPANYAQRAGRAGRSKNSAAYALSFCNKSNHDFTFFKMPEQMIRGKINPPKFNVENDKIAIRHLYASALSFFWKRYPQYFSRASDMVENKDNNISGYDAFTNFLNIKPTDLMEFSREFLPGSLADKFRVESYGWIEGLLSKDENNPGILTKAVAEYDYEVEILNDSIKRAIESEKNPYYLQQRVKVYKNEEILAFLSRKNVLPKYGFPVDTVEMTILDKNSKNKFGLQLQRDLSMAISEYAPDSQIVANGNLITSRYIRKIPNMSWKMYDYIRCKCETLNIEPHVEENEFSTLKECKICKNAIDPKQRRTFLIPSFGFEADGDKIEKPGLIRPERTYRGDVAHVGYKNDVNLQKYKIKNSDIELLISYGDEMAVLNESNFYVCESCGYSELHQESFTRTMKIPHKNSAGYGCKNDGTHLLKRYSLGYRFETDVLQLRFINPDLYDRNVSLSVLYGLLRGICSFLNIDQNDISGCLQYFYNGITYRPNFALVLYDKTPGGAGHVRRLNNQGVLEGVIKETLRLMEQCDCGGETKDSSCYSCLRNYYNQKHHDDIKRGYVIDFLNEVSG